MARSTTLESLADYITSMPSRRRCQIACNLILPRLLSDNAVHPKAWLLLHNTPPAHLPESIVMATTGCRWSELSLIDVKAYFNGQPQEILARKHGQWRQIAPPLCLASYEGQPLNIQFPFPYRSYDSLSLIVGRAVERSRLLRTRRIADHTHIYRHLYVLHRTLQGDTLRRIADLLGQRWTSSTHSYLGSIVDDPTNFII